MTARQWTGKQAVSELKQFDGRMPCSTASTMVEASRKDMGIR
ncbi:hypothetical protein Hsar01_00488 [Haloferula sargassicola]|uniref:Uncharacterized protein n=1 Tax=Haloferula sargassicola TaxID=490096 RepID=A0ABP9UKQ0_9BACT